MHFLCVDAADIVVPIRCDFLRMGPVHNIPSSLRLLVTPDKDGGSHSPLSLKAYKSDELHTFVGLMPFRWYS